MREKLGWTLGFSLVLALCLVASAAITPAFADKRVALVIGNGDYKSVPKLPNPPNDANDVATSLGRLNFTVHTVLNARYDDMRRALLQFGRDARTADIAVVFYAGHGIEVAGENWLIPTDAELRSDIDVDHEAISLRSILPTLESSAKLGLVILDACRNNPFAAKMKRTIRTRAVARGLAQVEPTGNVLVAYAAKDGTTAADGDSRNSPYTAALLKHIEQPGLEINFLFRNVRDDVISATKREQLPFVYGSLSRDAIYLKPPLPKPPTIRPDAMAWSFLRDGGDIDALRKFIDQFPYSPLVTAARQRIAALEREAATKPKPPRPDEITWSLVQDSDDVDVLKNFVRRFPASPHRGAAEARIAALQKAAATPPPSPAPTPAPTPAPKVAAPQVVPLPMPSPPRSSRDSSAFELAFWNSIKDSSNPSEFESYLRHYPNGVFVPLAKLRLDELKKQHSRAAPPAATPTVITPPSAPAPTDRKRAKADPDAGATTTPSRRPSGGRRLVPGSPEALAAGDRLEQNCRRGLQKACQILNRACQSGRPLACARLRRSAR